MELNIFSTSNKPSIDLESVRNTVIIGGGPAGYNAALYSYRKGFNPLLILGSPGGQVVNTNEIENYLGLLEVDGAKMAQLFHKQVIDFGIDIIEDIYVTSLTKNNDLFILTLASGEVVRAKTVILATGGNPRKLHVEGEDTLFAKGISYCAICDAPFFKEKNVVIVGGGDSAVEAAIDVAKWATTVHIVHRSTFRAQKILLDRMNALENVTYELGSTIHKIGGAHRVEYVEIEHDKKIRRMDVEGLFIEIGQDPNSQLVKDLVDLNENMEVKVDRNQQTSLPGLFAAGDVSDDPFKQIITAASGGAVAALSASDYLTRM